LFLVGRELDRQHDTVASLRSRMNLILFAFTADVADDPQTGTARLSRAGWIQ